MQVQLVQIRQQMDAVRQCDQLVVVDAEALQLHAPGKSRAGLL